jgi:hypothetical protein
LWCLNATKNHQCNEGRDRRKERSSGEEKKINRDKGKKEEKREIRGIKRNKENKEE